MGAKFGQRPNMLCNFFAMFPPLCHHNYVAKMKRDGTAQQVSADLRGNPQFCHLPAL